MSMKVGEIKNFTAVVSASRTPPKGAVLSQVNKATANKPLQPILSGMFSLEDQIKKMRNNQRTQHKHRN